MREQDRRSSIVVARATLLPPEADTPLHWDGRSGMCRDGGPPPGSAPGPPSAFQATGPPATASGARPCWPTSAIGLAPAVSPQAIAWDQEAARMTFVLDRGFLADATPAGVPHATGELVWGHWSGQMESRPLLVDPVLLVHAPYPSHQADRVAMVPALPAHDPLLHHIALVLQAAIAGEGAAGQVYAEALADALAVHFLRRYAAAAPPLQEGTGALARYKLRRVIAYIEDHLTQALSVVTLATVAQTSPAHFARLFKQATGLAPHQYVLQCRIAHAKRLLAETEVPLSAIGPQIGCADQSHFTALFRTHVSMTPKAYRDHTRR